MTPTAATTLLAYPNVSEGKNQAAIDRIGAAFGSALLDVHSDADHHRSAYTLAGAPGHLARAVVNGAKEAIHTIHLDAHEGVHPRVGAVDVAPIIYLSEEDRGAAAAEALVLADTLGTELSSPCSSTASSPVGARARSYAEAARPSCSAGSMPASSSPTSARPTCIPPPAPSSSPPGRRWWPSTSSSSRPRRSMTHARSRRTSANPATRA